MENSITEQQIELIADKLRGSGFDVSEMNSDTIAKIAGCVLDALNIEIAA